KLPEIAQRPGATRTARRTLKRVAIGLALLAAIVAAGDFGYHYWTTGRYLVSTDDAYVKADYTTIAPKVSGNISEVLVQDNQPVRRGEVLARIDDRDYRAALAQASADVDAADAAVRNLDAQILLQQSVIEQAKATVAATAAVLKFAQADAMRYQDLMKTGAGTTQTAQQSVANRDQTTAQLQRDQAGLVAAQNKIGVLVTARAQAVAQREHSVAVRQQAELNLSYTTIAAPVDGTVGARTLRVGQYVAAGTQLMAVVPLHAAYIVANFKETQLTYVRPGQPVEIAIDGFPDADVKGHVDSLSPASGLEFSLLPPDNATGNFTKIVQRIPVRIVLDDSSLNGLLRAGMSVEPTINTKATNAAAVFKAGSADGGAVKAVGTGTAGAGKAVGTGTAASATPAG
ncbi:MAG TPA: HlyD family secretion protein, partial [Rhodopila sp.]